MKHPRIDVSRLSYAAVPAKEVKRMAIKKLIDIEDSRRRATDHVWEQIKDEICSHYWGLFKHPRYRNRGEAQKHSQAYGVAANIGWGDYETCELLRDFAEELLTFDPNAVINLTADDYRALS